VDLDEYRHMAAVQSDHWWYAAVRALLRQELGPHLRPGGRFLDAGGGTGATGGWMAEHGALVVADVEPLALELLAETVPAAAGVAADVARLPFAAGSFDATLAVTVLYHRAVTDPAAAVAELARVTRPGGVVCLLEPGVRRVERAHDRYVHQARRFSLADLRSLLRGAGLEPVRATGAFSFLVPPALVQTVVQRGHEDGSGLDQGPGAVGGVLARAAAAERAVLRRFALPAGLSVLAMGRMPLGAG
jgi:SAM-dependent methyltransferase